MILSDKSIREYIEKGMLIENPINMEESLQPASYDITLGDQFLIPISNTGGSDTIDLRKELKYKNLPVHSNYREGPYAIIPAKTFVLAVTKEILNIPNGCTAFVEGRSSVGRSGLTIENAGLIDAGFRGTITLELFNATNYDMKIYPGMRIGQITFNMNDAYSEKIYEGKYQGQIDVTGSRIDKDFKQK